MVGPICYLSYSGGSDKRSSGLRLLRQAAEHVPVWAMCGDALIKNIAVCMHTCVQAPVCARVHVCGVYVHCACVCTGVWVCISVTLLSMAGITPMTGPEANWGSKGFISCYISMSQVDY